MRQLLFHTHFFTFFMDRPMRPRAASTCGGQGKCRLLQGGGGSHVGRHQRRQLPVLQDTYRRTDGHCNRRTYFLLMAKKKKYDKTVFQALAMVTQFGINMLVPIFICTFIGIWLDKKCGTSYIMIILFFVGALAGFRNIYLMARKVYKDKGKDDGKN